MNHLSISSSSFVKKKKLKSSRKKSNKKKNNSDNNNNNNKFTRYDKICFLITLIMFVSTYFYVEIMNTHNDGKKTSVLESSRYNSKQVKKLAGKVNNLKRKIRVIRKQLNIESLQEENDRKTIQTNHHLRSKSESKQSSKNSNVDTPPRFRQQKPHAVQNIYEEATKTNAEQSQENEVKKKKRK